MGFLQPLVLVALPLALVPAILEWRGRRTGTSIRFSSLYLLERARRTPVRWTATRSWWVIVLRCLVIVAIILAAARPVGPGRGVPSSHYPTRAIVAVDVSASMDQMVMGGSVWTSAQLAADSVLAMAGPDDRIALAAVADGLQGWWEGPPDALRQRLRELEPTARRSDWPRILASLELREENGTETYLFTDGARGAVSPTPSTGRGEAVSRVRRIRVWAGGERGNRVLEGGVWITAEDVTLVARGWDWEGPEAAVVGRIRGSEIVEEIPVPLDGAVSPATWSVADTATFGFREADRLEGDDRWFVARGGSGGTYRVARWVPRDEPTQPAGLFWEAALKSARGSVRVERHESLARLVARPPHLALLPLRVYGADQVEQLISLMDSGTKLLFVPSCAAAGCVPRSGWLPGVRPAVPDLDWRLARAPNLARLSPRPTGSSPEVRGTPPIPQHLLDRVDVRPAVAIRGGVEPEWRWDLSDGSPAMWARGPVGVWVVPLGLPVTRLGTTPVFPLAVKTVMSIWDPRWRTPGSIHVGEAIDAGSDGGTVSGPMTGDSRTWEIAPGGPSPRPTEPGIYRVVARSSGGDGREETGSDTFVAVNGDPREGDLAPIGGEVWLAAWGTVPVEHDRWKDVVFARRRGPELWRWLLLLAVVGLVAEVAMRRDPDHK